MRRAPLGDSSSARAPNPRSTLASERSADRRCSLFGLCSCRLERALMRRVDGVRTEHLQRPSHGVEASEEDRADEHAREGVVGGVLQHHANHRRREDLCRQVDPTGRFQEGLGKVREGGREDLCRQVDPPHGRV